MSKDESQDDMVRIKKSVNDDIKLFMKRNPTFESAGQVIEYLVRKALGRF